MEYFSTGNVWISQSKHYCHKCVNFRDRHDGSGAGCPIDDMHMECSDMEALEEVIPDSLMGDNYEFPHCSMFLEAKNT